MSFSLLRAGALTVIAVTITACGTDTPTESSIASGNTVVLAAKGGTSEINKALAAARAGTARYHQVSVAEADHYESTHECVAVPGLGGMGIHYLNMGLLLDPTLDPARPEVLLYEPQKNGRLKLVAVEYMIPKPMWDAMNPGVRPSMLGKEFEDGPMNTYALHAWVWENNPSGVLSAFNPRVSCQFATESSAAGHDGH